MAQIYGERWEVVRSLDEGGQAQIFLVKDTRGAGEVRYVLKRVKNPRRIERFRKEIEATRNLSHQNIVRLLDFNLDVEKPYLVTEYCAGGSLADADPFWRGDYDAAFGIFLDVCEGVAYAHARGIVHRDLKPGNIFLRAERGPAVVGDFGLCYFDDGQRVTVTDEAVGSWNYMAPELEDGRAKSVLPESDVYSLGKILYWLLSDGDIFSREKHRERRYDLKRRNPDTVLGWDNVYMEHVNRLLDQMITAEPSTRLTADAVLSRLRVVRRLVRKEFNPVSGDIRQPCTYCGQGYYELRATDTSQVSAFGLKPASDADWRIYTCSECGHVELFRVEKALKRGDWWGRRRS